MRADLDTDECLREAAILHFPSQSVLGSSQWAGATKVRVCLPTSLKPRQVNCRLAAIRNSSCALEQSLLSLLILSYLASVVVLAFYVSIILGKIDTFTKLTVTTHKKGIPYFVLISFVSTKHEFSLYWDLYVSIAFKSLFFLYNFYFILVYWCFVCMYVCVSFASLML